MATSTTVTFTDWQLDDGSAVGGKAGEPERVVPKAESKENKAASKQEKTSTLTAWDELSTCP